MVDIIMKVAFSADVTGLATAVAGVDNRFEGLCVFRIPGGSACEGACIAAGVMVVGGHVSGGRRTECMGE
jgi:hypothetical protein